MDRAALQLAVAKAREVQDTKDLGAALSAWQTVLQEFPGNPQGYLGSAAALGKLSRAEEADRMLRDGVTRFPANERLAVEYAWLAHHRERWPEADSRWSVVREQFPSSLPGYFGGGATLRCLRRFDEAEALYIEAMGRWPDTLNLMADYATLAHARGDATEASRRWAALRERFPEEPVGYLRPARELLQAGQSDAADAILRDAIMRLADNPKPLIEHALIAQQRGQSAEALTRWDAVATKYPGLVDGYVGAAHALNDLGRFPDAQNIILPAIRMFPKSSEVATLNAWIAHYQSEFAVAVERWADVRQRFPRHVPGYIGGMASLTALSDLEGAGTLIEEALRLFPGNVHVAVESARLAQQGSDWDAALRRWKEAFRRFPAASPVQLGYAQALSKSGQVDEAERLLETAVAQNGDVAAMRAFADCAAQRSDWGTAETRWRAITERFPEKSIGWSGLAEMLRDAGRLDESQALLTAVAPRFPGSIDLERQLAQTATLRRDWQTALPLWDELKRKYPANKGVVGGIKGALWQAQQDLGLAESEGRDAGFQIPSGLLTADGDADGAEAALRTLFLKFETIGDTCEFGIVQRRFGAEPISLLRWASTNPRNLVIALDTNFEGVGDPEHTIIAVIQGEYVTRDKRYHMFSHTFTPETAEPFERFRTQHLRRMQFLRRKLLDDLAGGDKIFVYKCIDGMSENDAHAIHRSIRRYGGNQALLCVRIEDGVHARGTIHRLAEGLWMGYTDRFSTVNINVDVWVQLCRQTEAAWREEQAAAA